MGQYVIGMDIGGTNVRMALTGCDGTLHSRRHYPGRIGEGREVFLELLAAEVCRMRDLAGAQGKEVTAIGIGVPGLVGNDGTIHSSVNMTPLEGVNLAAYVSGIAGVPTYCLNDANAAALGEHRFGAGRSFTSSVTVTIGTGLGSGLILGGHLWTGSGGFAAELGHITVQTGGAACPCGNYGCLEQYVSAGALVRYYHESVGEGAAVTAEDVARRARLGDRAALAACDRLGEWLGVGIASLLSILNLQGVFVGGGVGESFDLFHSSLSRSIRQRCFPLIYRGTVIAKAELGDNAGLLGAAAYAGSSCRTNAENRGGAPLSEGLYAPVDTDGHLY